MSVPWVRGEVKFSLAVATPGLEGSAIWIVAVIAQASEDKNQSRQDKAVAVDQLSKLSATIRRLHWECSVSNDTSGEPSETPEYLALSTHAGLYVSEF